MIYNGDSTGQDLVTLTNDLVKTTNTSYPINQKTRAANRAMRQIWSWIFEAYGGWIYDDANNTDLPEATTNLIANQAQYLLPLDSSYIIGMEIRPVNSTGVWQKLWPVTLEHIQQDFTIAEGQFLSTPSTPVYYRPLANGFKLYPAPNYSQTDSIKLFFNRDISAFTPTDTTKSPGFDVEFHEAIATFMALDYAKINGMAAAGVTTKSGSTSGLTGDWSEWERRIKKHYSMRFQQMFPGQIHVRDYVKESI